jgi:hypothetical protein
VQQLPSCLRKTSEAYKNKATCQKFNDAAVQELLLSARITCGADDWAFIVDDIKGKGLGLIATRAFSASLQTLQDQYGIKGFIEVLKEEQWEKHLHWTTHAFLTTQGLPAFSSAHLHCWTSARTVNWSWGLWVPQNQVRSESEQAQGGRLKH